MWSSVVATDILAQACNLRSKSLSNLDTSGRGLRHIFRFISLMTGLGFTLILWHSSSGKDLQTLRFFLCCLKNSLDIRTLWSLSSFVRAIKWGDSLWISSKDGSEVLLDFFGWQTLFGLNRHFFCGHTLWSLSSHLPERKKNWIPNFNF